MLQRSIWLLAIPALLLAQTILSVNQQFILTTPGWLYYDGKGIGTKPIAPSTAVRTIATVAVESQPFEAIHVTCATPLVYRNGMLLTSATDWPKASTRQPDYRVEAVGNGLPRVTLTGQIAVAGDVWRFDCVDAR